MSDFIQAANALATLALAYATMARDGTRTQIDRDSLRRKADAAAFKAVRALEVNGSVSVEALK